ncbi:isocitrate lyase/phosphoenolpyruvate mutase family protein [Amycolatopsis sp. NPDC088138]|uniref:isocitrate lyase/PEP mutase family protein n=1 Tax=Amycolatopsis sp. NPDC088138 TaxID=3363938 RepID=UPI00380CE2D0
MTSTADKAKRLQELHAAPELLLVVNVWDAITAKVVAETAGTQALATPSHGIAASRGYPDGEKIPRDEMIAEVALIVRNAGDLPVTADLEAGYGDPGGTVARAIEAGAVGCNLEDQMKPLADSVKAVEAAVAAAQSVGVDFVLNARTDAFIKIADQEEALNEAITRGRAYLEAGASNFFAPGKLDETQVGRLVEALGERKVNIIGIPGSIPLAAAQKLGVSRVSYGPWSQNVALTALAKLAEDVYAGGGLPADTRKLN